MYLINVYTYIHVHIILINEMVEYQQLMTEIVHFDPEVFISNEYTYIYYSNDIYDRLVYLRQLDIL